MKKIRTAVVGLGMGLNHAFAYHLSERSDLRWVVDLDTEKAAAVAKDLGCSYTSDWKSILDDVDAISFATPHHLHASAALEAMAAGKHVLMEKPLANTEEECLRLIKAAEENNVVLMVAYIVRFRPEVQRLKEVLDQEVYGKPINAECSLLAYLEPRPPESWFSRIETLGGGVLFSHGCHYIDLLLWLLGKPVSAAGLGTRVNTDWLEGEGTHHSLLEFESGALAHLATSWGIKYNHAPDLLKIHTSQACLILTGKGGERRLDVITAAGRETLCKSEGPFDPNAKALGEINHFLECIETGKRPLTDGYEGLKSQRVVWALYSHHGTKINLD